MACACDAGSVGSVCSATGSGLYDGHKSLLAESVVALRKAKRDERAAASRRALVGLYTRLLNGESVPVDEARSVLACELHCRGQSPACLDGVDSVVGLLAAARGGLFG